MSEKRNDFSKVKTAATEDPGQPSQRRRRLVKGALSAPVFLTLQSGAVLANSSNDWTVAQPNDTIDDPPKCGIPEGDTPIFEESSNKADFGEGAMCFEFNGEPLHIDGLLRCPDGSAGHGGYIITASSATSISNC